MTDRVEKFLRSSAGGAIAAKLGLVVPDLQRYAGGSGLPSGIVALAGSAGEQQAATLRAQLAALGLNLAETSDGDLPGEDRCDALVFDGRGCNDAADLAALLTFFKPMLRRLNNNGRVLLIAEPHAAAGSAERAAAQRALEGFCRSLAKEIGSRGSTAQLLIIERGAEHLAQSTLAYLLSQKSAFIDGQAIRLGAGADLPESNAEKPLHGKVVIVTGASRGIGESMARVLARDGAVLLGVDIPPAEDELQAVMSAVGGQALVADITEADAPRRIAEQAIAMGGADVMVHNAGVTRDKLLVNMPEEWWDMTLEINLAAAQRINKQLLVGGLNDAGRIIGVASMVGISGQRGQANYAASKAGVIGYVDFMSRDAALRQRGITVNAVAPGFIETQMTATIPVLTREVARRLNSLSQGGLPEDVAEAVAWLAHPGSAAVNGLTLRVCGQNWIGA